MVPLTPIPFFTRWQNVEARDTQIIDVVLLSLSIIPADSPLSGLIMDTSLDRYPRSITLNDDTVVQIRPLAPSDAESLITLFREVTDEDLRVLRDDVTNPATLRQWAEQQNHQRMLAMVAEVKGDLIGMYSLHRTPGTPFAHLGQFRMFVRADWREKGLGGQLIDDVIELARDMGVEQLTAELTMDSVGMITAFERRGFEREAILPVYQLVVMRYNLGPRPGKDALSVDHADRLPPRRLWPDLLFDESISPISEEVNLAELLLDDNLKRGWGRRPAIYYHGEIVSYDLLQNEVLRLANSLHQLGIKAGQLVWLHMPNVAQAIAANFAVQRLGAVSMPTPNSPLLPKKAVLPLPLPRLICWTMC
jgi:GNAT superfamily N-acetyltransferase